MTTKEENLLFEKNVTKTMDCDGEAFPPGTHVPLQRRRETKACLFKWTVPSRQFQSEGDYSEGNSETNKIRDLSLHRTACLF